MFKNKQSANILSQTYHGKQCRTDADGALGNGHSCELVECGKEESKKEPVGVKGRCRLAVCSKDGDLVDQHFGRAEQFLIYDYQDGAVRFLEARPVEPYGADPDQAEEDRIARMVKLIDECNGVVCMRIGSHPSRVLRDIGLEIFTTCDKVQNALKKAAEKLLSEETADAPSACG